ncbi:Hypothetical_protein [Hexamita inflata]|uniref:Hypothetical_protein n=1 Tax=Hexamita inflata TaxID=28002 RepID=A0AA86U8U3_9EUKA|nr:Hypothetical protein HINF_LOCUS21393 [Hexamita inflata]
MDSSNSQPSYLSMYIQYINSTPNIYGLKFRSKKASAQNQPTPQNPEIQDNQNIKAQIPEQQPPANSSELPTIIEQIQLEHDTENNLSIIHYQKDNETICQNNNPVTLDHYNINRLIQAFQVHGMKAHQLISRELHLPVQLVQRQAQILFTKIEEITVSADEWEELSSIIDFWDTAQTGFYHSINQYQMIVNTFKAAFKVTRNQKFSVQYCCKKFGVDARLVNTLVRYECAF